MMNSDDNFRKRQPERVSGDHNLGITPFGVFCFECNTAVGKLDDKKLHKSIRMHITRKKHAMKDDISYVDLASDLKRLISIRFGQVNDYKPWIDVKSIKSYLCSCGTAINNVSNMKRHIKMMEKTNPESNHTSTEIESVLTVCGRTIEKKKLDSMAMQSSIPVHHGTDAVVDHLVPNNGICLYIPLQSNNRRWITMSRTAVKNVFAP